MKKLMMMSAIAMSGLFFQTANAQIGVHFNINLGPRPVVIAQAPVYDEDYYYLPEVEAYYSVNQHCYFYQDGSRWISAAYLPGVYRNYDWQHARRFAVRDARPYLHNDTYRARYGGIEGRRDWNYRDDRSRMYADRDRVDHNQYRGNDYGRNQQFDNRGGNFGNRSDRPQNDNRGNYGDRNDHQQSQQNDNRGNVGGRNDHQQSQPQGNDHGNGNGRGNDNNRGGNDNRQGRSGRI